MKWHNNSAVKSEGRGRVMRRGLASGVLSAALLLLIASSLTALAQSTAASQVTITVSNQGMTPTTATVTSGIVHLLVKNESNVETLRLKVTREGGEVVREMTAPNKADDWAIELELQPGQYTISEATNTSWRCHVTAQAPSAGTGSQPNPESHP